MRETFSGMSIFTIGESPPSPEGKPMSEDEAARVSVTYSHDTPEHKALVVQFATFLLTRIGLDVHLDTWYDAKRMDWSRWAVEQLNEADFILVIASSEYKRRADG